MSTIISARVEDQSLLLLSVPKIASGGANECRVEVLFDDSWKGYGKTAIFYRNKSKAYHVVMTDDACLVPHEVLAEAGRVYFGIMGASGSVVRTTEVVALAVSQGAITGVQPVEPLPDVYAQVLSAYGLLSARVSNLATLPAGSTSGDAELIDARLGQDGITYSNLGTAIRTQFGYGLLWRTAPAYDADACTAIGFYFAGGSENWANIPGAAGMLVSFYGNTQHRLYQLFFEYNTNDRVYVRHMHGSYFTEWVALANDHDLTELRAELTGDKYIVRKQSDTSVYIYKRGSNGFIRYHIGRAVDTSINLDTVRLIDVQLCDGDMNVLKTISASGADLEGVVLLKNGSDHIGGVHGDEVASVHLLFIDGKGYTLDAVPDTYANEVRLVVRSTLYHVDTTDACMTRIKQLTFDRAGVHIRNEWDALESLLIQSVRACMFSVNKDCITHYYDSNVNLFPVAVPENSASSAISENSKMTDVYYMGDITARHWAGERGGDPVGYSTLLQDYGYRLKSYFNCYDGHEASPGEKLIAENHFRIGC